MYLLIDFGYKNPDWIKVLDKWKSKVGNSIIDDDRYKILDEMRHSIGVDKYMYKQKPKLEFLKKTYIDSKSGKKRKVTTGIARIPEKSSKKVEVEYLAGNPKSTEDNRFKGALDSLDKKVGKRKIKIVGINDDVDNMYKKKFGDRLI